MVARAGIDLDDPAVTTLDCDPWRLFAAAVLSEALSVANETIPDYLRPDKARQRIEQRLASRAWLRSQARHFESAHHWCSLIETDEMSAEAIQRALVGLIGPGE